MLDQKQVKILYDFVRDRLELEVPEVVEQSGQEHVFQSLRKKGFFFEILVLWFVVEESVRKVLLPLGDLGSVYIIYLPAMTVLLISSRSNSLRTYDFRRVMILTSFLK